MTVRNPIVWIGTYFSMLPSGDQLQLPAGSAAAPGAIFRGTTNSGLYYTATQVNVSVAGSLVLSVSATGLNVTGGGIFSGNVQAVNGNFTGLIQQNANTVVDTNRLIYLRVFVVSALPASPPNGVTAFVSDSTQTLTAGIGTAVVGGGANNVPVYSDAGTWKIG